MCVAEQSLMATASPHARALTAPSSWGEPSVKSQVRGGNASEKPSLSKSSVCLSRASSRTPLPYASTQTRLRAREAAVARFLLSPIPSMYPTRYAPPQPKARGTRGGAPSPYTHEAADDRRERPRRPPSPNAQGLSPRAPPAAADPLHTGGRAGRAREEVVLFTEDLPDSLSQVLQTEAGRQMAVQHFTGFLERVKASAGRQTSALVAGRRKLAQVKATEASLAAQARPPPGQALLDANVGRLRSEIEQVVCVAHMSMHACTRAHILV